MKTITRTEVYNTPPQKVFSYIDDLGVTGMHITQSSANSLITAVHESLSFPVVHVPVLPPEKRVDFILKNI